MMTEGFTPISAAVGGLLIGLSATVLMATIGRIAGISGIVKTAVFDRSASTGWQWSFIIGLLAGAAAIFWFTGAGFEPRSDFPLGWTLVAGLFVGFGTSLGSGCTSGHGICGTARISRRSITATMIFVGTAMAVYFILRHLLGVNL
jgi:uncharacterized membrane protein YedE/YeeE